MNKTKFYRRSEREWVLIDAGGRTLGRLASRISQILQGKHRPDYTPNSVCGDRVVVINSEKIKLTGKKQKEKKYDKYSGYAGGRKEISFEELTEKNPAKALMYAVKGMLPKNLLRKEMLRSLKIYPGAEHKQVAQKPQKIDPLK